MELRFGRLIPARLRIVRVLPIVPAAPVLSRGWRMDGCMASSLDPPYRHSPPVLPGGIRRYNAGEVRKKREHGNLANRCHRRTT